MDADSISLGKSPVRECWIVSGENPAREIRDSREKPGSGVSDSFGESPAREIRESREKPGLGDSDSLGEKPGSKVMNLFRE